MIKSTDHSSPLLFKIVTEYHNLCKADELLIDEMELYREQDMPKKLIRQRLELSKKLRQLDEERYKAIAHDHNIYRNHYAQTKKV